jgi:crotonobetainyl-CoA:carnitine CoA-transferase CaiB-like acyl-CoA transferase
LANVRVLDLTQVLAGPTAGRTLAEYGADVIKINNPNEEGAGFRFSLHRYHTDVNRGKRTMLLDLKTESGRALLSQLLDSTDVLLENFRPGVAERLGIGYAALRARRPDLVYVSVSAYGRGGRWGDRPGYEVQAQAATGMSARFGGDGRPQTQPYAVNDYGTGLLGAFAAALALYQRSRTGQGQRVEVALAYTATLLQSTLVPESSSAWWSTPRGPSALGWGPLQRMYEASDGWFFLGARTAQLPDLLHVLRVAADGDVEDALAARFASHTVQHWTELLVAHGMGAHALVPLDRLMHDPWVMAHGLSITRRHDTGEDVTTVGPPARLSRTPVRAGPPVSNPGADAAAILEELGQLEALEALQRDRVILIEPSGPIKRQTEPGR